ncbi:9979_t:CDS:2 [Cetraspora pellucida]|uniref:9979_t:CDS:1 n=1 Tax=Cetraspora pellucida TaxID=1433469 RepID=A0ACA9JY26_9GLOM|nr:9979_t:CDS:2 [Cetraspora pellucida]
MPNASDEERSNHFTTEPDIRDKQDSDTNDKDFSANEISVLLKRLETLERLQVTNNKKTKNQKLNTNSDDTVNEVSKKRRKHNTKKKKSYRKRDTFSSEMESTSDELVPIENLNKSTYVDIPKALKLDKAIYNSYQAIEWDQPLEVVKTSSSTNNMKNACLTSSSRVLLTVLRCQNTNHKIQDRDLNDAIESVGKSNKMSQNSDCQLRGHASSSKTTKIRCMKDDTGLTKEESLKMSSKTKTNGII